jgi:hypothetical protein
MFMKKLLLSVFLIFALSGFSASSRISSMPDAIKTLPGDMYYILFMDGCYHLGIEVAYPDGSVWWVPVGFEYGYAWCCTNTICMDPEEFDALC